MGQIVSDLWRELWKKRNTRKEYSFTINGTFYGADQEVEHSVESALYEDFGIGNAYTSSLTISLYSDNIPKGAEIKRYVRLVNGDTVSEWIPKGVFFVSGRSEEDGYWTVKAFDAMRKADSVWVPNQSLVFPMTMPDVVQELAKVMGVEVDARTGLYRGFTIDYPANDQTIRNVLCHIAAAHGGNWIITDAGMLRLVPLLSSPAETSFLVDERGDAITFGGVRILA